MNNRAFYSSNISIFLKEPTDEIVGKLSQKLTQNLTHQATLAWSAQINLLKKAFAAGLEGHLFFEFLIPRMGRRVDAVLLIKGVIFVIEFKIGAKKYSSQDLRQVEGYALDLANFHEPSHHKIICPILVATNAEHSSVVVNDVLKGNSKVLSPIKSNSQTISNHVMHVLELFKSAESISADVWENGRYKATPTIIEAAQALYSNHDVKDISRSSAEEINIIETSLKIEEIILNSQENHKKSICFVTGVPGAGKTLVGLNIASKHQDSKTDNGAVFLSGNGPLVSILREALAKDSNLRSKKSINDSRREIESLIQNVHRFRDQYLDELTAPSNRIVLFDEAQRAWNADKTIKFMRQKRGRLDFLQSEPEFLVGVMDRHTDWCVVIALIGGGQEINSGEAGLNGWVEAFKDNFKNWDIYYSERLKQAEYIGNDVAFDMLNRSNTYSEKSLHLSISMRSFRTEKMSHFVHYLVHNDPDKAKEIYVNLQRDYPIVLSRDLSTAKAWIREKQRGPETAGIVASSGAKRLRADGITVSNEIDPIQWFLNGHEDVRSSNYMEEAGSEFLVQGLELDWVLMAWDADYRYRDNTFEYWQFKGTKWQSIKNNNDQKYLVNSYRVLLTRARQGMVIYIPQGNINDPTRLPVFFNETYDYLIKCGLEVI